MKPLTDNEKFTGAFLFGAAVSALCILFFNRFEKCRTKPRSLSRYDTNRAKDTEGKFSHFFKDTQHEQDAK